MTAAAQRQSLAEKSDRHVVAAEAPFGGKSNLMRPIAIDRAFAQLAFAIDHGTNPEPWLPPALDGLVVSDQPIPVPAPCTRCGGIIFETKEDDDLSHALP